MIYTDLAEAINTELKLNLNEQDTTNLIGVIKKIHEDNVAIRVHGEALDKNKFEEVSRPLIKYLCENYHPHVTVIVTPIGAELLEGLKTTGRIEDYIRD